jgi:hypothetical protein
MTKPKYIRKYDFLHTFYWQKSWLFHSVSDLEKSLNSILNENSISFEVEVDEEEFEEDGDEEREIDYNEYKNAKESTTTQGSPTLMFLGRLIEEHFNEQIIDEFNFDDRSIFEISKWKTSESQFDRTLEIIRTTKISKYLILQPTFISNGMIAKPDAIIVENNLITIVECKGTTSTKRNQLLDLYYQYKVISSLGLKVTKTLIALVDYKVCQKGEISITFTEYCNCSKNAKSSKNVTLEHKSHIKLGYFYNQVTSTYFGIHSFCIINSKLCLECEDNMKNIHKTTSKGIYLMLERIRNLDFKSIIEKLKDTDMVPPKIETMDNYQDNFFKNMEYLNEVIKPFHAKADWRYRYTSRALQGLNFVESIAKAPSTFPPNYTIIKEAYRDFFYSEKEEAVKDYQILGNILNSIEYNKVYFDFESINPPVAVIDNSLPFQQIVTQCSLIIQQGSEYKKAKNLICDPKNITIDFFKEIIDSLYMGNTYKYIVYNKSFEKSRLQEIDRFINQSEYSSKISVIISNIFDLADLFDFYRKNNSLACILNKKLYGYYSIKKVLKVIDQESLNTSKAVDYKKLNNIQNGQMAMNSTLNRALGLMSDNEWNLLNEDLKKYCENDVRAMIAVELYCRKLNKQ